MARRLLFALLLAAVLPRPATAQFAAGPSRLQIGVGMLPGGGLQIGYVAPQGLYTVEGAFYVDVLQPFTSERRRVQLAGVVGGALRFVGIFNFFRGEPLPYDVDFGLRFGPGLRFAANETRAEKNQRFRLVFEPFARVTYTFGGAWTVFAEAGSALPHLRAGLWVGL